MFIDLTAPKCVQMCSKYVFSINFVRKRESSIFETILPMLNNNKRFNNKKSVMLHKFYSWPEFHQLDF